MIVVTVFLSILNQMEFHLVQNQMYIATLINVQEKALRTIAKKKNTTKFQTRDTLINVINDINQCICYFRVSTSRNGILFHVKLNPI